jgi:uncharacterized protein YoxC
MEPEKSAEQTDRQSIESSLDRLESIVEHMGDTVITVTETVEHLAQRLNILAVQIQNQEEQIKQQGYQIFALSESLQTLVEINTESTEEMRQLTAILKSLFKISNRTREKE